MKIFSFLLILISFSLIGGQSSAQSVAEIKTFEYTWTDSTRHRDVPVKIYAPDDTVSHPLIIFSHGLGGSREGYSYLGEYWAQHGYISVHVQHFGSDDGIWKGQGLEAMVAMKRAAMDPDNFINRPKDITFAIDQITQLNAQAGLWSGRFDLEHIGVAGHSFGGYTAMAIAGQHFSLPSGKVLNMGDPRVKAVIAMSVPVSWNKDSYEEAYGTIHLPVFHMTGTKDVSPIGETTAEQRRIPYDYTKYSETYLLTLNGGDHMVFSGRGPLTTNQDRAFQKLVLSGSTAFWDAYLKGDGNQKDWLVNGGFSQALGGLGTFEKKQ